MRQSLLLVVFLWSFHLAAQDIHISGTVLDGHTREALPYAAVALSEAATGHLVSGSICGEDGRFSVSGNFRGEYRVTVSFMGYRDHQVELLVGDLNTNFDLGRIMLMPSPVDLEEVTVAGRRESVSADMEKKVFQMDQVIAQSGGSVLDAMKAMPGITVDQEGRVILRGSDKVVILIDGKQSSLTGFGNQKGLDNIPSSNIETIEIINNPSAKYDAAGMAGIINIIYKKEEREGLNGEAGFSYGIGALTRAREDLPTKLGSYGPNSKYTPSLNMNFRKKKLNLFLLSEAIFQKRLPNNEFTTRTYDDGRVTSSQVPENRSQQHYILNGGAEYFLNDRNTLKVSGIYDWESHVDTAQVPYIDEHSGQRYRYITWNEEEITGYMNYALQYNHQFLQAGHELDMTGQYTRGWEDETYHINDSSAVREGDDLTNILAIEHTASVQADYTRPLRSGRVESGAKIQVRRLPVEYTVARGENSIIYQGMGSWTDWGENLYALYANYIYERPSFDVEAGLRAEHTDVFYEMDPANTYYDQNDAYNYFELFPNVRLSYKPGERHRFSAFYNRRVDRPGEPELRIFAKSDDHELLKVGNPYLRPQFTQSFELAYRFRWESGSFYLAGYHRIIKDPYSRVYTADTTNQDYDVIVKIYANTGSATNSGAEMVFSQQVTGFWKISGNANLYRNTIHAFRDSLRFPYPHQFSLEQSSEFTWDAKLNNLFAIGEKLEIQLTFLYLAPRNIAQGTQHARASVDLGLAWKFLDGKGEFGLSASDIFNTYGIRQEIAGDGFTATYENYFETQVYRASIRYKF